MQGESGERARILVVDDERGPRESLRMILSPRYEVRVASGGEAALRALRESPVDLVTLDLHMPGMKGADLMRAVRTEFPRVEIVVITGCGSVATAVEGLRHGICDYLIKPFDVVQVTSAVVRALARQRARRRLAGFLGQLGHLVGHDREAREILDDLSRSRDLRGRLGGLLESATSVDAGGDANQDGARTVEFLEVLAETIERKDRFMRGHARRVAFYADLLADHVRLPSEEHERVRLAAFLHDLGKVGVPSELLERPGALEPGERTVVEQHPDIGARLVRPLEIPTDIESAIRHHHEWWDGSGYPDGLAGEAIPRAARIIGVADAFDAMSSDRPYRNALPRDVVLAELRRFAGTQFDPDVAKAMICILESGVSEVDPELLAEVARDAHLPRAATG